MTKLAAKMLSMVALLAAIAGCQPDQPAQQGAASASGAPVTTGIKPPASSQPDPMRLAQINNCLACHKIDQKLVGPAWKEVAAKYRGQKDAEARLIDKVAKGGSGVWGSSPMPPNAPRVSEDDIRTLVRFILTLE